ncbi:MAG: hypothetical protein ACYTFY_03440 [Planctomycetota bacterium]|jgi:hypothetical protein
MNLSKEIETRNQLFCKEQQNIILNLAMEAVEKEFRDLGAPQAMRMVFSLGRTEMESNSERIISRLYSEDDVGRVCNFYQFVNDAYRSILQRTRALDFEDQQQLDNLQSELSKDKKEGLAPLSLSTVMSLEALMEYDRTVIEAKSKQTIEKRSYTNIRDVARKKDETSQKLKDIGQDAGVDIESIYQAMEDIRLKINSIERSREDKLKKGQKKFMDIFADFSEILQEHIEAVSTIGFLNLPNVYTLEEIPMIEKNFLSGIFYKIISADKSILPQKSDSLDNAYPMPVLVLLPVTGYVVAASSLAVERFRQNVILFPMRCLEDPVSGIARELLKLKKKIDHRREQVAADAYRLFARKEDLMGKSYEEMYEKFLRFCIGDEKTITALENDERRLIGGHFLKKYTSEIFVPPEIWPIIANMNVGSDRARAAFNEAVVLFRTDPFTAGTLHADRAVQYHNYIVENKDNSKVSGKIIEKHISSRDANLKAAKRLFKKSYQVGTNSRFALFNMALLLILIPAEDSEEHKKDLDIAIKLLQKSMKDSTMDFWTYKAESYIAACYKVLNQPEVPEEEIEQLQEDAEAAEEDVGFAGWVKARVKKGLGISGRD